jgi:DNA mismatch endonuclease (patch repair protein)
MASIRGKNTLPERTVRRVLHELGFRFRLHRRELPGRPDIVLPKWKLAILVHGCFWHQHRGCRFAVMPKSNYEFWSLKLGSNVARDERTVASLHEAGWRTLIIWECALKKPFGIDRLRGRLKSVTTSKRRRNEIPRIQGSS